MNKILILGANSAIAHETAKIWAKEGKKLFLVARNAERLESVRKDLEVRGADIVDALACDLNLTGEHAAIVEQAEQKLGGMDGVLIAFGSLGDQKACEKNYQKALEEIKSNFLSPVSLLTHLGNLFQEKKTGTLVVISSVAGDRGRQSNYVYGASKGALSLFLQGLRNRLFPSNVQVITVKPGFVATPMTAHLTQGALFVSPAIIAKGIIKSIRKKRDVVYLPWFWWGIMAVIKSIPEFLFKRLKL